MKAHLLAVAGMLALAGFVALNVMFDMLPMIILLAGTAFGMLYWLAYDISRTVLDGRRRDKEWRERYGK